MWRGLDFKKKIANTMISITINIINSLYILISLHSITSLSIYTAVVHSIMSVKTGTIGVVRLKAYMAAYIQSTSGSMPTYISITRASSVHMDSLFVALRIDTLIIVAICPDRYRD